MEHMMTTILNTEEKHRAYVEGLAACRSFYEDEPRYFDESLSRNPYGAGTDAHGAWRAGWRAYVAPFDGAGVTR